MTTKIEFNKQHISFFVVIAVITIELVFLFSTAQAQTDDETYPIAGTGQGTCCDNSELIDSLAEGEAFCH